MLAVFSNNKRCVSEVAPWYVTLLLKVRTQRLLLVNDR